MRQRLMHQIRMAGMARMHVREDHDRVMAELLLLYGAKQINVLTGAHALYPSMPKKVRVELLAYTTSRNMAKAKKDHMLLEIKRQQAFRYPSMRKKLMREIRQKKPRRQHGARMPTRRWVDI